MSTRRSKRPLVDALVDPASPWTKADRSVPPAAPPPTSTISQATVGATARAQGTQASKASETLASVLHGKALTEVRAMVIRKRLRLTDGVEFTVQDVTCPTDPMGRALKEFLFHLEVTEDFAKDAEGIAWKPEERMRKYSGRRVLNGAIVA
jgi:hypothetical protein